MLGILLSSRAHRIYCTADGVTASRNVADLQTARYSLFTHYAEGGDHVPWSHVMIIEAKVG